MLPSSGLFPRGLPAAAFLLRRFWWLALFVASCFEPCSLSGAAAVTDLDLKAAGVFNLVAFVEWPPAAFAAPEAPLVIGVLGRGQVGPLIDRLAMTEKWHGRAITVQHYSNAAEIKSCHVLYIERSIQPRWPFFRSVFTGRPILTVSDAENFSRNGGMFQLAVDQGKLRLTVNLGAARTAGLSISSKVLRLAEVIDPPPP